MTRRISSCVSSFNHGCFPPRFLAAQDRTGRLSAMWAALVISSSLPGRQRQASGQQHTRQAGGRQRNTSLHTVHKAGKNTAHGFWWRIRACNKNRASCAPATGRTGAGWRAEGHRGQQKAVGRRLLVAGAGLVRGSDRRESAGAAASALRVAHCPRRRLAVRLHRCRPPVVARALFSRPAVAGDARAAAGTIAGSGQHTGSGQRARGGAAGRLTRHPEGAVGHLGAVRKDVRLDKCKLGGAQRIPGRLWPENSIKSSMVDNQAIIPRI